MWMTNIKWGFTPHLERGQCKRQLADSEGVQSRSTTIRSWLFHRSPKKEQNILALAEWHCLVQQLTNATGLDAKPRVSHLTPCETPCFLDFTLFKLLSDPLALHGTCKINFKLLLPATVLAQPEEYIINWVMHAHHVNLVVPKIYPIQMRKQIYINHVFVEPNL